MIANIDYLEAVAVIFTLLCVIYTSLGKIVSWPLGIIGIGAFLFLFYREKLYADFGLQFIFLGQSFVGWVNWRKSKKKNDNKKIEVEYLPRFVSMVLPSLFILSFMIVGNFLLRYTDASYPYLDAFVATGSLLANWLLVKRKIEAWVVWMAVDIMYVYIFISKGLEASAILYSILFVLAGYGLFKWMKLKKDFQLTVK